MNSQLEDQIEKLARQKAANEATAAFIHMHRREINRQANKLLPMIRAELREKALKNPGKPIDEMPS